MLRLNTSLSLFFPFPTPLFLPFLPSFLPFYFSQIFPPSTWLHNLRKNSRRKIMNKNLIVSLTFVYKFKYSCKNIYSHEFFSSIYAFSNLLIIFYFILLILYAYIEHYFLIIKLKVIKKKIILIQFITLYNFLSSNSFITSIISSPFILISYFSSFSLKNFLRLKL